ncbi:Hsp20/alpha crystallin family protein [Parageobacillus thermoglucosidasius]|uniref:Heat-shock protein Hsp20 n=1 Tax=Parageobacillus thermoglucosidasius TaxID=1426 RepID=A0AAN0YNE4_PARTM|nr:heat-shock protein Hsp20 [Parageobacillus thermoglucosidasius]REK55178.1 MAG: heat-shock protein Hsp20 [Geobacillus sp.]ALF10287.1 heat-shock protein Hsp20 [Parageobacillus thermoglucosidasius]ANZ30368.1 heat-shock protein Hsp20 [Parageobacillus thermoglucosidasius]APM81106.1 heat-shock protein Hsp20 [Parageobacillus thermoglucosidasius]KJX68532.1 small heat-shock protein, Hsp20-like family [Parageobacillus thermoglucosidasius]
MENRKKTEQHELRKWLDLLCGESFTCELDEKTFRIDVFETDTHYIIEAEIPNCLKEQLTVLCETNAIIIQIHKEKALWKQRAVPLPFPLQHKQICAYFSDPTLEIHISKAENANNTNRYAIMINERN